jgi:hypothetical protein
MLYTKDFAKAFEIALHPEKMNNKKMSFGEAISFYYKYSIIPFIATAFLFIVLNFAFSSAVNTLLSQYGFIFPLFSGSVLIIFSLAMAMFIIIPILLVLFSWIYQGLGRLLGKFNKSDLEGTITAAVYGIIPGIVFFWALFILPIINELILLWGIIIFFIAVSKIQKVYMIEAFYMLASLLILIAVIVLVLWLATFWGNPGYTTNIINGIYTRFF